MSGKLVALGILLCALIAGAALYYLQVYGFYDEVSSEMQEVELTLRDSTERASIPATQIRAIDADSSPIRFRACFETSADLATLTGQFEKVDGIDPRNAPGWFDCFDAEAIGAALKSGSAQSFLGVKNVAFGVDSIVAITGDGQGFIWHELNDCGEKPMTERLSARSAPSGGKPGNDPRGAGLHRGHAGTGRFYHGSMLNARISVLRSFNIPDPVSGGLLAALVALGFFLAFGLTLDFDMQARDFFLVMFFAAIGMNARLDDLIAGGKPLLVLLALTLLMILAQNIIGVAGAVLFGYAPSVGVLFGSAALIGGHGTAIAWSPEVTEASGLANAQELGVAVATLGLVLAALIGGPIARYLVEGRGLTPERPDAGPIGGIAHDDGEEDTSMTPVGVARVLLYLNLAIILGYGVFLLLQTAGIKLPLFVPCLIMGILIANLRRLIAPRAAPVSRTPALALVSEITLGTFLAMSLMSLQLWTLVSLGGPILTISPRRRC